MLSGPENSCQPAPGTNPKPFASLYQVFRDPSLTLMVVACPSFIHPYLNPNPNPIHIPNLCIGVCSPIPNPNLNEIPERHRVTDEATRFESDQEVPGIALVHVHSHLGRYRPRNLDTPPEEARQYSVSFDFAIHRAFNDPNLNITLTVCVTVYNGW